jgi:acetyltransferase-like isoleucine patch superfamily enzyme
MALLSSLFILLLNFLPWPLRRLALVRCYGYAIHPTARIGFCFIKPRRLVMEARSRIGHLTAGVHLDLIHLKPHALIGRGNWITGFPSGPSKHFAHQPGRRSELVLGEHAAITNRHLIDCTGGVTVGRFTTVAGFHSQILSHSIDLEQGRQSSAPVTIGAYCFVGTQCVILGGSVLPDFSALGAKSLLNKEFSAGHFLYAGCPAKPVRELPESAAYFHRTRGFVE